VSDLVFSSSGQVFATSGPDKTVRLWDAGNGQVRATLAEQADRLHAFSPDGRTLAGSRGQRVWLWDALSGKIKKTFDNNRDGVDALTFAPDGETMATASLTPRGLLTVSLRGVAAGRIKATNTGSGSPAAPRMNTK
jgi:WD40 repeat protein